MSTRQGPNVFPRLLALVLLAPAVISFADESVSWQDVTVAIIGTGDMGDSLGPRFAELGFSVVYGSRDPEGDRAWARSTTRS